MATKGDYGIKTLLIYINIFYINYTIGLIVPKDKGKPVTNNKW